MKNWILDLAAAANAAIEMFRTRRYWRSRGLDMTRDF
jgi:hypothetical protein